MNKLSDENIDFIYLEISKKGITMEVLLDEMVDHVCCCIEPEILKGTDFMTAYNNFIQNIDNSVFKNIQHQTLLSTNLKFQNMKKVMFISGVLATILLVIGATFKIYHLPGAGVSLVLGTFIIVSTFLPLFFIVSYREQTEKKNILLSVIGYITITFLILGPIFKIMHWPYTNILFYFGPLLLATIFLPVYLVSVFRKANETKTNFLFIIMLISIGFSFMYSLSAVNISKDILVQYDSIYQQNIKTVEMFKLKNESFVTEFKLDSTKTETQKLEIEKIKASTLELENELDSLMLTMIRKVNSETSTFTEFENKDDKKVCKEIMELDENDKNLKKNIEDYQILMLSYANDEIQKQIINNYLGFDYLKDKYDYFNFKSSTLIDALAILSMMQKNIQLAEYEVLKSI